MKQGKTLQSLKSQRNEINYSPRKRHKPVDTQWILYVVSWVEGEKLKEGHPMHYNGAVNEMKRRLSEGFPAWIIEVYDEIPF